MAATGAFPWGNLLLGSSRNLCGTMVGYGSADVGGIFELGRNSDSWSYSLIYNNGAGPGLLMDEVGNLFGAIGGGDYFGIGAIGELSPGSNGWVYTDLFNFNPTVGYAPPAPPIWDGHGNLYGTTSEGGISQPACWTTFGCGLVFKMTAKGNGTWDLPYLAPFRVFPE